MAKERKSRKTSLSEGDVVIGLEFDTPKKMRVEALLDVQFTAIDGEGRVHFYFYADYNTTWKMERDYED